MSWREEQIGDCRLICADCLEVLPTLGKVDAVVTDPPWDQAKGIHGSGDPRGLFATVSAALANARMVTVQLGCYTDPCFLAPLARLMPFFHACWLSYVPPSYNGRILMEADVAYVYGDPPASKKGARVIPGVCQSTRREDGEKQFLRSYGKNRSQKESAVRIAALDHPMPRHLAHVRWLTKWHTETDDTVCDPFVGSGTTGVACIQLDRKFIGIEIEPRYFEIACRRIEDAYRQRKLFPPEPPKPEAEQGALL